MNHHMEPERPVRHILGEVALHTRMAVVVLEVVALRDALLGKEAGFWLEVLHDNLGEVGMAPREKDDSHTLLEQYRAVVMVGSLHLERRH